MKPTRLTKQANPSMPREPESEARARIGMYGGTFDPIHFGHLAVARDIQIQFALNHILFIPASQSPFREPPIASGEHRLAMVRLAIADTTEFQASAIDIHRSGPSFMIDTVEKISDKHPEWDLFLIVGADAFAELPAWRRSEDLLKAVAMIVVPRSTFSTTVPSELSNQASQTFKHIHVHHMPPVDISASTIRDHCARALPITALVPMSVDRYINDHRLYGESEAT